MPVEIGCEPEGLGLGDEGGGDGEVLAYVGVVVGLEEGGWGGWEHEAVEEGVWVVLLLGRGGAWAGRRFRYGRDWRTDWAEVARRDGGKGGIEGVMVMESVWRQPVQ